MNPWVSFEKLIWQSDFNGDEVGYDDVNVVGFYMDYMNNALYAINMETMEILYVEVLYDDIE
jgi:hypothetical protein